MTVDAQLVEREGWRGYAQLIPLLAPIDSVESHPENPRRGNLDVVATSLQTYGQTKPIIVQDSTGYIVAGNHTRLAAMERLGWREIALVRAEMTDEEALGYLMMDNRSSDLGHYDDGQQIKILERLHEDGRLATTGYTPDELDDLLAAQARLANAAQADFEQARDSDDGQIQPEQDRRETGDRLNEVVLLYGDEQFQNIATWLKILQREWNIGSQSGVVFEALRRSAEQA